MHLVFSAATTSSVLHVFLLKFILSHGFCLFSSVVFNTSVLLLDHGMVKFKPIIISLALFLPFLECRFRTKHDMKKDETWHQRFGSWHRVSSHIFELCLSFHDVLYRYSNLTAKKQNSAGAVMNHNLWSKWRIVICFCQKRQVSACTAFTSYNSCNTRHNVTQPITDHQHQHQLQNQHQHHCSKTLNAPISMPCKINPGCVLWT